MLRRVRTAGMMQVTLDLAVAVGLFVLGVLEVVFGFRDGGPGEPLSGPLAAEVLAVAGMTLPLAWGRRRPLEALAVVAVALSSQAVFLSPSAPFAAGLVPLLLLTFSAAHEPGWRAVTGLAIAAAGLAVTSAAVSAMQTSGEILFSAAIIGGIWLAGRYAGSRQRRADQLTSYAARLEREQDRLAQEALARQLDPDIVLMDIRMPGVDGIEATRRLTRAGSRSRVLMLTTFDLDEHVYDSFRAGASGFLLKNAPPEQLVAAIRTVAAGDALLAPEITRRLIEEYVSWPRAGAAVQGRLRELSERELDVLRLIAAGLSNAEIAAALFVSQGTVKTHVTRILAKLALRDRVQAAVLAYETGLIRPGTDNSPSHHPS